MAMSLELGLPPSVAWVGSPRQGPLPPNAMSSLVARRHRHLLGGHLHPAHQQRPQPHPLHHHHCPLPGAAEGLPAGQAVGAVPEELRAGSATHQHRLMLPGGTRTPQGISTSPLSDLPLQRAVAVPRRARAPRGQLLAATMVLVWVWGLRGQQAPHGGLGSCRPIHGCSRVPSLASFCRNVGCGA